MRLHCWQLFAEASLAMKHSSAVAPPRRLYDENADTSDEEDEPFQPIPDDSTDQDSDALLILQSKPDRTDTSAVMRRAAAVRKKYQKRVAQRAAEARRKKRDAALRKNSGLLGPMSAAARKASAGGGAGGRGSPTLSVDTATGPVPGVPSTKQARYLEQAFSLSMKYMHRTKERSPFIEGARQRNSIMKQRLRDADEERRQKKETEAAALSDSLARATDTGRTNLGTLKRARLPKRRGSLTTTPKPDKRKIKPRYLDHFNSVSAAAMPLLAIVKMRRKARQIKARMLAKAAGHDVATADDALTSLDDLAKGAPRKQSLSAGHKLGMIGADGSYRHGKRIEKNMFSMLLKLQKNEDTIHRSATGTTAEDERKAEIMNVFQKHAVKMGARVPLLAKDGHKLSHKLPWIVKARKAKDEAALARSPNTGKAAGVGRRRGSQPRVDLGSAVNFKARKAEASKLWKKIKKNVGDTSALLGLQGACDGTLHADTRREDPRVQPSGSSASDAHVRKGNYKMLSKGDLHAALKWYELAVQAEDKERPHVAAHFYKGVCLDNLSREFGARNKVKKQRAAAAARKKKASEEGGAPAGRLKRAGSFAVGMAIRSQEQLERDTWGRGADAKEGRSAGRRASRRRGTSLSSLPRTAALSAGEEARRAGQDAKRGPKRGTVGPQDHASLMAAAAAIHEAAEKKKAAAARKKDKTELACSSYLRKAIAEYSVAVKADPGCAVAWFNRGVAYSRINKERQAIEDFTKCVDLGPRAGVPPGFSLGGGHAARDVLAPWQVKRNEAGAHSGGKRRGSMFSRPAAVAVRRAAENGEALGKKKMMSKAGQQHEAVLAQRVEEMRKAAVEVYNQAVKNRALVQRRAGLYDAAAVTYLKRVRPAGDAGPQKKSAAAKAQDEAREEGLKARRRWNMVQQASSAGELSVEGGGDGAQGLITFAAQRLIFDNALAAPPRERTKRQKRLLIEESDTIQYLSKFPNKVLYKVWGELQLETYRKDTRVIGQGDDPDKFYIVFSGLLSIRIWKKADTEAAQRIKRLRLLAALKKGERCDIDEDADEEIEVATVGRGVAFGELGLIWNQPRSASAVTVRKTQLLSMSRKAYFDTIHSHEAKAMGLRLRFLHDTGIFEGWDEFSLNRLNGIAREIEMDAGSRPILQGREADKVYFLYKGVASALRTLPRAITGRQAAEQADAQAAKEKEAKHKNKSAAAKGEGGGGESAAAAAVALFAKPKAKRRRSIHGGKIIDLGPVGGDSAAAKKKKRESEGDTYRVAQLLPGDVFGHEALEGNQHSVGGLHKTSIKCNTPVVAICVNRDQFLQFECYKACGTQARILARGLHLPSDAMLMQACVDNRRRIKSKAKIIKRHERDAAMNRARKTGDIFRGSTARADGDDSDGPKHAEPMHFG